MENSCQLKYFPMGLYRDIDEPVICNNNAIFIQNTYYGSKIMIYNIMTGKIKSITMKGVKCFNVHADNKHTAFEFSGEKRGIAIVCTDTLRVMEFDNLGSGFILGGIWDNYIVFRRGHDIVLFDINEGKEKTIASCHHIIGSPVVGIGTCAWLQLYKGKCCIVFYDIVNANSLIISSQGYINKIFAIGEYLIYQSCSENKCSIYAYSMNTGELKKIFESLGWIELYKGKDGVVVWTVKKEYESGYLFDIWIYNMANEGIFKVLSDRKNAVIPTASDRVVVWVDAKVEGDNLWLMPIE